MPSELMDRPGVSPSFFSDEVPCPDGRQVGFWKRDAMHDFCGTKSNGTLSTMASSPLEKRTPLSSQVVKGFEPPNSYLDRGQKVTALEKTARSASYSLPRAFEDNLGSASYFIGGDKVNFTGAQYENGLFSSSLSELFTRKLRLSSTNTLFGHSAGAANLHEEQEPIESLEELEAQTIGNLLPDDDELFSGVTDGIDCNSRLISGDDLEDLDLFCSVGGLDLGEDGLPSGEMNPEAFSETSNSQLGESNGTIGGEHPFGEHPSRTLFVRNINSNIEDSELQALFEQYGEIRTLYTACKHRGFVMISYYDIRAAWNAKKSLQNKPLRRRKLDIHFSIPKDNPSEKDVNQGTLIVLNLDSSVSNEELRQIFGLYGEIKKIHETPHRVHHKFIEFYDVRAADAALRALNRSDIAGKRIKVEPCRPGGSRRSMNPFSSELDQDESGFYLQQSSPPSNLTSGFSVSFSHPNMDSGTLLGARSTSRLPMSPYLENAFNHGISSSVPNSLPSLLRAESFGNMSSNGESCNSLGQLKFDIRGTSHFHPHSLPDYDDGLAKGSLGKSSGNMSAGVSARSPELLERTFGRVSSNGHSIELNENVYASGNGSVPSSGHHYIWNNSHRPRPEGIVWPNSSSFVGATSVHPQNLHAVARAPSHLSNGLVTMNNHHVGSAPSVNPSLWERQRAYAGESPDASVFHPGSLGSMRIPGNSPHIMDFIPRNMFPGNGGSCMDLPIPSKNIPLSSHNQRCLVLPTRGQMIPMMSSFDSTNERSRSRRNEGSSSQAENKKQFELDIDRIMRGEDKRTTLMIKNIPNKYTSKMLLAAIDERHRGTYDFLYLPIDFKNKCNVGYAFINMTDPSVIVPFHHAFNGKKWEKFNSEKVASLAYARIQGKAALIAHFQNSSLMNEDKRCRPILFHTDGPNAGDQVPFPMGVNIRPRSSKNRSSTNEENNQDSQLNSAHGDESSIGYSSSVSAKDSD